MLQPDLVDRPCPDCRAELAPGATKCRCGWKAKPTAADKRREQVPCEGVKDCTDSAIVQIGSRKLCARCYAILPGDRDPGKLAESSPAVRACLEAFSKSRYVRRVKEVGVDRAKREAMEPGQDDEERRVA